MKSEKLPGIVIAAAAGWAVLWAVAAASLPLLPVDETRYLTVAWEMRLSHQWLLPTLNGLPYSHKPPLLFWLVNLIWTVTGPQLWAARLVPLAVTAGVLVLTCRLARTLYGERSLTTRLAPLLLLTCPAFIIYGNLIMFDLLLTCCTTLALMRLWRAAQDEQNRRRHWLLFGLFTGLGVLAKGPVVLLYVAFPALLAPFFMKDRIASRRSWHGGLLLGLLVATLTGLAWAVPAAIQGGKDFAEMIFVKQSAGRMVESFAHRRPPWFYLPFVPGFALPLIFWPPFWRALRNGRMAAREQAFAFLAAAALGPFIAFSLISGKQIHYLLPLLPSCAVMLAALFDRADKEARPRDIIGPAVFFALIAAGGIAAFHLPVLQHSSNRLVTATAQDFHPLWIVAAAALTLGGLYALRGSVTRQALAVGFGMMLFTAAGVAQAGRTALPFLDLRPVSAALQAYKDKPLAFAPKYAGEIGYQARLEKPLDILTINEVEGWLAAHPGGIVIVRQREEKPLPSGEKITAFPYKGDQSFTILKGRE